MGIILAGDRSGTGKTTLTLALLAAIKHRGHTVQSFKVGPDYIDPMFHAAVTNRPCYNLDPLLTSEAYVQQSYRQHCAGARYSVIEGVMGLFDGATGIDDTASTAHIARLLGLPVVLAVDCGRMSRSLAALIQGYRSFDSRVNVAGVILNRVGSDRHLQLLQEAIAAINMPILGVFRREKDIQLPDRHLGLVPTGEIQGFQQIAERLAVLGEKCFDWRQLAPLLGETVLPPIPAGSQIQESQIKDEQKVRIAIAHDAAFNFYYPDNFEILKAQGAELIFWSPMSDQALPAADGLYFGGGFPEVFAGQLSENMPMIEAVREAIAQGIPTYAECGGLMYLSNTLIDFEGKSWPMVGSIPQTVKMGSKLALGYRTAEALQNGPLLKKGQVITGHEFHRSGIVESLVAPAYHTQRYWGEKGALQQEGYQKNNLHASYVHLHWGAQETAANRTTSIARQFINSCSEP
ncbi:MAG: cobyrinic acid a,c-diamide synthase CobB [Phormidesmis priestleyi Ana]|uniref:Cobyrinate a,c-diamide synthase n=1 Tax=Phormidesmis priestleyi Ana TaxID=1666911 RepID=A0A0P7ZKA1_9CYAN|nr:MAG: cobyrinic acid a,c-diamide synthase CobB [Phormidesmis priestleyi Ana]